MEGTMKAIVFEDKGKYRLKEVLIPQLRGKDVLIKVIPAAFVELMFIYMRELFRLIFQQL